MVTLNKVVAISKTPEREPDKGIDIISVKSDKNRNKFINLI